jgi:cell division protein ZapA
MARPWERIVAQNMKVEIYGQSYNVVGDLEPDYAEELARYVDGTMREIARATGMVDSVKVAVLSALAIADELHTLRNTRMEGTDNLRERAERCIQLIEKALEQSA